MRRLTRSEESAERVCALYACALLTVHGLFLPYGGYARMMEGKYRCYLALTLGFLAALCAVAPPGRIRFSAARRCAAAYLGASALSALCSPYGAAAVLGGSRREGLLTLALYAAAYLPLSRWLRARRLLLWLTAGATVLCCLLTLRQLAGGNPLRLYPAGLTYYDGDGAYLGFYAGTAGNIDFTAFLLALALCVLTCAALRLRMWGLLPAAALAAWVLRRLDVSAAWVGVACAAVWGLALLLPDKRRAMLAASAALCVLGGVAVFRYTGGNETLSQARAVLHGTIDPSFGAERVRIWRDCLSLARERPLLRGGPDTLGLRGVEPFSWYLPDRVIPSDVTAAHNEYLNILVNQGAPALAAYLGLLASALCRCFRRASEPRYAVCGAGLLCYAAMAFFSISTCITAPYVWLLLALCETDEKDG